MKVLVFLCLTLSALDRNDLLQSSPQSLTNIYDIYLSFLNSGSALGILALTNLSAKAAYICFWQKQNL